MSEWYKLSVERPAEHETVWLSDGWLISSGYWVSLANITFEFPEGTPVWIIEGRPFIGELKQWVFWAYIESNHPPNDPSGKTRKLEAFVFGDEHE